MRDAVKFVFAFVCLAALSSTSSADTPWKFIVTDDSRGDDNGVNTPILGELLTPVQLREAIIF